VNKAPLCKRLPVYAYPDHCPLKAESLRLLLNAAYLWSTCTVYNTLIADRLIVSITSDLRRWRFTYFLISRRTETFDHACRSSGPCRLFVSSHADGCDGSEVGDLSKCGPLSFHNSAKVRDSHSADKSCVLFHYHRRHHGIVMM